MIGFCTCSKNRYPDKKTAKHAIGQMKATGFFTAEGHKGRLMPYRCPDNDKLWHFGHATNETLERKRAAR